jgi:predicted XRE-type DNA-binding protein
VNVVWLDTRPEAVVAERAAIRSEKPIHNVAGTRLPRVRMRDLRPDLATREAIGMEVRVEIARSGRRKAEIREVLGLSRQSMWQCVKGEIAFSEDELAALADHLGISVDRFVPKMAAAA